jgi:hypothetical protein
MAQQNAWDDLQDAAKNFVGEFSESVDQLGLVSFQLRGTNRFTLARPFKTTIKSKINAMQSFGDTNTGEGLKLAYNQLTGGSVRPESIRVVVFFTDGRPTAFRGNIGGQDRMMAVYVKRYNGQIHGYFNNPDQLPTDRQAGASGCEGKTFCMGWTEPTIRNQSKAYGLQRANEIRADGIHIFSIGLGNVDASDPLLSPDMDYLRQIANEDGVTSASQPQGKAYFAPTADELDDVFRAVAEDIVVRLTE